SPASQTLLHPERLRPPMAGFSGRAISWKASGGGKGAGHAGPLEAAIAVRVLRQILLMFFFREVEFRRVRDLGRDPAETGGCELILIGIARGKRGAMLIFAECVDCRTVGRADVVA